MGKKLLLGLGALAGLVIFLFVLEVVAGETGEVVLLRTSDGAGATQETRLWVVDHEGAQYLRAGMAGSGWYQNLLASPTVEVVRDGASGVYSALSVPAEREVINTLMRSKYGWRESYIGMLVGGRADAVPIRLDPVD